MEDAQVEQFLPVTAATSNYSSATAVLHTTASIGDRDSNGRQFGLEGFTDYLVRHHADRDLTVHETLRRLVHTVLDHLNGETPARTTSHRDDTTAAHREPRSKGPQLADHLRTVTHAARQTVLVDLSELSLTDSTGLPSLLQIRRTVNDAGGIVALVAPSPPVQHMLDLTRLSRVFHLHPRFPHRANRSPGSDLTASACPHAGSRSVASTTRLARAAGTGCRARSY
ncbi:STAS domain-containing protein [Streptomyces lavendofoliae]|uniref:STAS domain-containing protein n=1 Tax=Streptomyces lavendofoliae TaxID=67314 RepID=UPI003D9114A4